MTTAIRHTTATETARVTRMADALTVPDGGYTVHTLTGGDVTSGYAVAVYPDREQQLTGRVNPADISAYVFANADLAVRNGHSFGGWRDPETGIAYLDVSRVVATATEARALATEHGQVAYFDLNRGESVRV